MDEKRYLISADDVWEIDDLKRDEVEVPEWQCWVRIKELSAEERDQLEASIVSFRMNGNKIDGELNETALHRYRRTLVSMAVVDGEDKRLFSDEDVARLGKKSSAAIGRIFDKARSLSQISEEDVEAVVGNSDAVQPADSPSD